MNERAREDQGEEREQFINRVAVVFEIREWDFLSIRLFRDFDLTLVELRRDAERINSEVTTGTLEVKKSCCTHFEIAMTNVAMSGESN